MQIEEVIKSFQEHVAKDAQKEVVPSKTGILKRTKKPAHRPRHSPEPPIVEDGSNKPISSPKEDYILKIKKIRKPSLIEGVRLFVMFQSQFL